MRVLLLIFSVAVGYGLPTYSWTDMGTPAGGTYAMGLSQNGNVTGGGVYAPGGTAPRAWTYVGGVFTILGTLGGPLSDGWGINNSGQVGGRSQLVGLEERAARFSGGSVTDLGTLGGFASIGQGINNSGWVTGYAFDAGNNSYQAFIENGSGMYGLGTLGGGGSGGYAINTSGWVAGFSYRADGTNHAMLYNGTTMLDLGTLGGAVSLGYGLNDAGDVVGVSLDANGIAHAFLSTYGFGMVDLGTLGGPISEAFGVNSSRWVVGASQFDSSGSADAFLFDGTTMWNMNDLTFTTPVPTRFYQSRGINDAGQMIANGRDGRAYLLTPVAPVGGDVPEPGTWVLMGLGLGGLALRRLVG